MTGKGSVRPPDPAPAATDALEAVLGSPVVSASRIPWGDTRATYRVELADGRAVAARALGGADALERAATLARRAARLDAGGVAVAHPAQSIGVEGDGPIRVWSVTPWVEGPTGASALSDPDAARRLGAAMGALAGRIAAVDTEHADANSDWRTPVALGSAAERWLAAIHPEAGGAASSAARRAVDTLLAAWDGSLAFTVGLAHGDFAPINVIVDGDGRLVVVDLDDLQPGPRLLDVAWWGWVVRHHHPEAWGWSWATFVGATGLDPGSRVDGLAATAAIVRLVERAAAATEPEARARWLGRLQATTASVDAQASRRR